MAPTGARIAGVQRSCWLAWVSTLRSWTVEKSAELAAEAEEIAGRKNIPVIQFADGVVLVEPSDATLWAELKLRGLAQ